MAKINCTEINCVHGMPSCYRVWNRQLTRVNSIYIFSSLPTGVREILCGATNNNIFFDIIIIILYILQTIGRK